LTGLRAYLLTQLRARALPLAIILMALAIGAVIWHQRAEIEHYALGAIALAVAGVRKDIVDAILDSVWPLLRDDIGSIFARETTAEQKAHTIMSLESAALNLAAPFVEDLLINTICAKLGLDSAKIGPEVKNFITLTIALRTAATTGNILADLRAALVFGIDAIDWYAALHAKAVITTSNDPPTTGPTPGAVITSSTAEPPVGS
jgi:hypothetical protein